MRLLQEHPMEKSDMQGKIFDIRRFSTHDGEGIRTTVFMKGCPLQCVWCQNPEGIDSRILPIRMGNSCICCGKCVEISSKGGVKKEEGIIRIDRTKCDDWDKIIEECPSGAFVMDSKYYSSDELMKELLKDKVFYDHGGGVTFSGGEPLMQAVFLEEILRKLKEKGIHTAIETSLNVSENAMTKQLPYLDSIYADMKIYDEQEHKSCTGVSNILIKKNLKKLLSSEFKDKVIIRTPLIPTYTATEKNLAEIAEFLSGIYSDVKYELLNYNPLAEAKYHLVGKKYCFKENPKLYKKEQMLQFGQIVKEHGIKNLIMEI